MNISDEEDVYVCPSFSSYSSNRLAEIAGRVAVERSNDGGDADFEFVSVREDIEVSLEEFSHDGEKKQTRQVFPVFSRDLLVDDGGESMSRASGGSELMESSVAVPLSKLFIEEDQERDYPPSCSSSDAEESETVPASTYCVWRPRMTEAPPAVPSQCKKSKSTGSASRRWKLADLLRRSRSDGKDSFVFLTPKQKEGKSGKPIETPPPSNANGKGLRSASGGGGAAPGTTSAHAAFYVRSKAMKEGDKRKSYLPYRQGLIGYFANVNGLNRGSFPHF